MLSPISVHPDYFRLGIATAMIQTALVKAKEMGYRAVFLCGDPNFYTKFGLAPSYEFGLVHVKSKTGRQSGVWFGNYLPVL